MTDKERLYQARTGNKYKSNTWKKNEDGTLTAFDAKGKSFIIDSENLDLLIDFYWYVDSWPYVVTWIKVDGKYKSFYLHRIITQATGEFQVDHINGDKVDNRKSNLRLCSKSENSRNTKRSKRNTSGYKGVSWSKQKNKWEAKIYRGSIIHLGCFDCPKTAHDAYKKAAVKYHGQFAKFE